MSVCLSVCLSVYLSVCVCNCAWPSAQTVIRANERCLKQHSYWLNRDGMNAPIYRLGSDQQTSRAHPHCPPADPGT
eukprot:836655-Rhodomonas_salina.1